MLLDCCTIKHSSEARQCGIGGWLCCGRCSSSTTEGAGTEKNGAAEDHIVYVHCPFLFVPQMCCPRFYFWKQPSLDRISLPTTASGLTTLPSQRQASIIRASQPTGSSDYVAAHLAHMASGHLSVDHHADISLRSARRKLPPDVRGTVVLHTQQPAFLHWPFAHVETRDAPTMRPRRFDLAMLTENRSLRPFISHRA